MDYYFLYTTIRLGNVGGVLPSIDNPAVTLGLGEYNGLYLGKTTDPVVTNEFSEYFVSFITAQQAMGLPLMDVTEISEMNEVTGEITTRVFTTVETEAKVAAVKLMYKFALRPHLAKDFSDIPDMVADINKKYEIIERIFMEIGSYLMTDTPVPAALKTKYAPYFTKYQDRMLTNDITIRADIEPDSVIFYDNLLDKSNRMNDMVNALYLQAAAK